MPKLIFVYNADSGVINGMFDFFHKIMNPSGYSCDLCLITHSHIGMRKAWRNSLKSLKVKKQYLHKDEFKLHYPNYSSVKFPAIFLEEKELIQIITSKDLENIALSRLIRLLKEEVDSSLI